jgi:Lar family restriction alleviation protein
VSEQSLKPCPFCGGAEVSLHLPTCRPETPYDPTDRLYPWVVCRTCHVEVPGKSEDYRGGTASAAWNRRAEQSDLALAEARRKALEEAAKVCEASSGVNAIPETNAYANGWNDCRKEAFDARQRSAAAIRAMREPK